MANKTPEQEPETTALAASDIFLVQTGTVGSRSVKYIQTSNAGVSLAGRSIVGVQGVLINGKISVTVASNNITVAIKTISGNDPSATEPVFCRIGDTMRAITAALSVTKNAGTNYFNSGATELATLEQDYFTYLGYNTTDGVTIGFARIPYAAIYSDFNTTATNEKYCAISNITHAAAGDDYTVIGRFAATLSATASFNWSVPTFTTANLIQRPIYETRYLTWAPQPSASGSMTFGTVTFSIATFVIRNKTLFFTVNANGTTGGTASTQLYCTPPFTLNETNGVGCGCIIRDTGFFVGAFYPQTTTLLSFQKYDLSNFALAANKGFILSSFYRIAA